MRSYYKKVWTCAVIVTFILFCYTLSFAQYENIKGVQFKDGSIIYGKVIKLNIYDIQIETKDGQIISRKFDDAVSFIKDTGIDSGVVDKSSESKYTNANAEGKPSDTGFYVAILGGGSMPMDMKTTLTDSTPGVGSTDQDVQLKTGWLAGAKFGYLTPFTNRILAVELEYNHINNDFDTGKTYNIAGVPLKLDSNIKTDALMFNLIGRYPEGKFHPYIGAGAGYANVQIDAIRSSIVGINLLNATSGSKGVFAYQILAGVDFDITRNCFIGLGYKYFAASKASYDISITSPFAPGASDPGSVDAEYKSSIITFSVGYLF